MPAAACKSTSLPAERVGESAEGHIPKNAGTRVAIRSSMQPTNVKPNLDDLEPPQPESELETPVASVDAPDLFAPRDTHVNASHPAVKWAVPFLILAAVATILIALRPQQGAQSRTREQGNEVTPSAPPREGR